MAEAKQTESEESVNHYVVPRAQLGAYMQDLIGVPAGSSVRADVDRRSPLNDLRLQWGAYGNHVLSKIDSAAERSRASHEEESAKLPEDERKPFLDVAVVTVREKGNDKSIDVSGTSAVYSIERSGVTKRLDGMLAFRSGYLDPATLQQSNEQSGISLLPPGDVVLTIKGTTSLPVAGLFMGAMGQDRIIIIPAEPVRSFYNAETKKFQPTRPAARAPVSDQSTVLRPEPNA